MSKHRLGTQPNMLTVSELGYDTRPADSRDADKAYTPNAREIFAALGVLLFLLALIVGVGALIAFTTVNWTVA